MSVLSEEWVALNQKNEQLQADLDALRGSYASSNKENEKMLTDLSTQLSEARGVAFNQSVELVALRTLLGQFIIALRKNGGADTLVLDSTKTIEQKLNTLKWSELEEKINEVVRIGLLTVEDDEPTLSLDFYNALMALKEELK